jgi:AAA15 family ATPase/GTPase
MSELLLDSLEIKGYRCFEHLTIEKLGRVNLIVGKNNVGKTALLEALWIWAKCDRWEKVSSAIQNILHKRKEMEIQKKSTANNFLEYRHLFYGRPTYFNGKDFNSVLLIGENKIVSEAYKFDIDHEYKSGAFLEEDSFAHNLKYKVPLAKKFPFGIHYFSSFGYTKIELPAHMSGGNLNFHNEIQATIIPALGLTDSFLIEMWDEIVSRNKEFEIINALKLLSEKVINLNFTVYPKDSKQRIPVVHLEGVNEKVPLGSIGEGMNRILGLILAITQSQNGILLVDEIENGFHYSVLPDVWKLIFKTAKDLNVQVFATTHSKDCVEAFTQAAIDDEESEGMLIRLERQGEKIIAKTVIEERLELAIEHGVELR